jgi:hypothetical protein
MKFLNLRIITPIVALATPFLFVSTLNGQGFGNQDQGFGQLQTEVQRNGYNPDGYPEHDFLQRSQEMNNPICYAIKNQKKLELLVEHVDILNKREIKIVTNKYFKGVQLIENSHFDPPKEFAGFSQPNVHVICQLPITKQQK